MKKRSVLSPCGCVIAVTILLIILFSGTSEASYEIGLNQGWNLVSLPEQPMVNDVAAVTASIEGEFLSLWAFVNGQWEVYDPLLPGLSTLQQMNSGIGYWINMRQSGTLVGTGMKPPSSINLASGWNLIGYNGAGESPINEVIGSLSVTDIQVWAFIGGQWFFYDPQNPSFSDLDTMEPGKGYWIRTNSSDTLSVDMEIPQTTKAISLTSGFSITSFSQDQIVFSGSSAFLDSLNVGDIIASEPIVGIAPDGFLVRVTGIERNASTTTVTIETPSLEEAIEKGVGFVTKRLTYDDIDMERATIPKGFALTQGLSSIGLEAVPEVVVNWEKDLGDGRKIKFTGKVKFEENFVTYLRIDRDGLKDFSFALVGSVDSSVKVSASQELELVDWKYDTGLSIPINPQVVWIGWVPVVLTPKLSVWVGVNGKVAVTVSAKVGLNSGCAFGVGYSRENKWRAIKDFQYDFYHDPFAGFNWKLKAWLGPEFSVYLYGMVGPYMRAAVFVDAEGEIPVAVEPASLLGIYAGLELKMGIQDNPDATEFLKKLGVPVSEIDWEFPLTPMIRVKLYPDDTGTVSGQVIDQTGGLQGVKATLTGVSGTYSAFSDENGNYNLIVPPGYYARLEFAKEGYSKGIIYDITVQAGGTSSTQQYYMSSGLPGSIEGTITNAVTGSPVGSVEILIRKGMNNQGPDNPTKIVTTGSDGKYRVNNLEPGYYMAETSADGYIQNFFNVLCIEGQTNTNQNASISPLLDTSEIRIILSWGATPRDLDSHLTGPIQSSADRFHVYYSRKGSLTASPFAALDHDDTSSYGPETITIVRVFDGLYRYSVHDYSDRSSATSDALSKSGAQVNVFRGNNLIHTYNVLNEPGTLWTVFEYDGHTFVPIDRMQFVSSPSSVTSEDPHSDAELMIGLPSKEKGFSLWENKMPTR